MAPSSFSRGNLVAGRQPGVAHADGMRGGRTAVGGQVQRNGQIGLRRHVVVDRIAVDLRARRQHHRLLAAEGQLAAAARPDGRTTGEPRDLRGIDAHRRIAEGIGQRDAHGAPGHRGARHHAHCLRRDLGRRSLARRNGAGRDHQLLRRAPGRHPVAAAGLAAACCARRHRMRWRTAPRRAQRLPTERLRIRLPPFSRIPPPASGMCAGTVICAQHSAARDVCKRLRYPC